MGHHSVAPQGFRKCKVCGQLFEIGPVRRGPRQQLCGEDCARVSELVGQLKIRHRVADRESASSLDHVRSSLARD